MLQKTVTLCILVNSGRKINTNVTGHVKSNQQLLFTSTCSLYECPAKDLKGSYCKSLGDPILYNCLCILVSLGRKINTDVKGHINTLYFGLFRA